MGNHPPPLNFLNEQQVKQKKQEFFPLQVVFCQSCGLLQLEQAINPKIMFKEYAYTSSASIAFKNHLHSFADLLKDRFQLKKGDLVIDIASNDGTLLEGFLPFGVNVLGVEPSNIAKLAEEKGISTINEFFDENVAKKILKKWGKAKVITATNVFAHVNKLDSFVRGVTHLLDKEGSFVSESHYLRDLIEKLEYDTIYHEHLRYYGLKQLIKLFEKFGMEVFDVEKIPTHGGSIRVFSCFRGKYPIFESVKKMVKEEDEIGLSSIETVRKFAKEVEENRDKLRKLLLDLKSEGKRIVGISAPARSSTILNYCNINSDILDYIAEKSTFKIGKYTPGTNVRVVSDEKLVEDQPDYALLLSWHLKDSIIPKIRKDGYKGKFIVPLPNPQII